MTRRQLCEIVGISPSSISVWKSRRSFPDADIALALARALSVTVEYLLDGPAGQNWSPVSVDKSDMAKVYTVANENQELQRVIERLIACDPERIHKVAEIIDVMLR